MLNRRTFLAGTTAAATLLVLPRRVFGANERIVTGHIGLGGQGRGNLGQLKVHAGVLCDVDSKHLAEAAKGLPDASKLTMVGDYRRVLDRKDVDAVVISTPDHWHVPIAIEACEAGKDVYCEKPLTLTIAEGRRLVEAARKHGRIVQTGSQQRSGSEFRRAAELVRGGAIGKIKTVLVGIPVPNHPGERVPDSTAPPELDYNFWLGPAPQKPYNVKHVHYNFRFFRDYSGGQMTNWGAHHIDIAQWALDRDNSGPIKTVGTATFHPKGWHEVTETCRVVHTYDDGIELIVGQGEKDIPGGTTFIGGKGANSRQPGRARSHAEGNPRHQGRCRPLQQ